MNVTRNKKKTNSNSLFLGRAILCAILVLCGFLFLMGRLFHLQVIEHELYTTRSNDNRIKLLPLPPTRGQIFDRNGEVLATNIPIYNLEIVRQDLTLPLDQVLAEINTLVPLTEEEIKQFERGLRRSNRQESVVLKKGLTEEESALIAINLHKLNGVNLQADLVRVYPYKNRAVHAIGYVGRVDTRDLKEIEEQGLQHEYSGITHIGKRGAEKSFEHILRGSMGFETVEASSSGRTVRKIDEVPPVPGKNIYLTLDLRLQILAEEALEDYDGAIVALDPQSGDVLAFVSKPTYDPNLFVDGITHKDFNELNNDPSTPFLNRVMQGLYPPGSVIKPQIGLAGLENDFITENTIINCKGYFSVPGNSHKFRDMGYYGPSDLRKSIERSCDVFFYELAYNMGVTIMTDFLKPFALGTPTNIDLLGESKGVAPTPEYKRQRFKQPWYTGDTITAGIGQSYWLTTPLQIAQATAIVGMRGEAFEPHILGATAMPPSNQKEFVIPNPIKPIVLKDEKYWDVAIDGMVAVVHGARGTARATKSDHYKTAGKTGTAQVKTIAQGAKYDANKLDRRHRDHAWYVAFAPVESPKIAISVIVENGGSGSRVAAPIAKKLLDAWLLDFDTPYAKETLARVKAEEGAFAQEEAVTLPLLELESMPYLEEIPFDSEGKDSPPEKEIPNLKSLMNIRLGSKAPKNNLLIERSELYPKEDEL
ncbi:penicillin-binding protein 2 [Ignatzschineria cameli]|uniref:Peptidoglycan D,D-transpeptidase MrdA n=1 Tax=Ignatzschineria cameli TaxID=2182793 RepID=A0A2U2AQB5_9GAMM|nr:penicillin-binding protein 2 [Ignatzschineria cameli]PWD85746.1 penicillin-binding protein 2 [Ignatzschineria cameli]PWD89375.1 penicillin-binding protein 2 [Ignatzschineria cameli]PWD90847.1 penicillin-binding protein 2 [Ignatzschineria cameli]PWD91635.1 penicillin-binding protein 2 [Ignatzschineria cameli]